jgi:hypothetical protein
MLGLAQPFMSQADDLFRMTWRATVYTTGANGQVTAKSFTEKDFLKKVASDNGLEAKKLAFVYRPNKHDTAVVMAANGAFVADVIQMQYNFTDISNTTQTKIVRQAFLNDEAHTSAIGSAFGTESVKRDADGNVLNDNFHGTFQYSIPEENSVYSGSFSTGARVKDTSGGDNPDTSAQ